MPPRIPVLAAMLGLLVTLLPAPPPTAATLPPGGTFWDDNGSPHEGDIEAIAAAGVTLGCGGGRYCPAGLVTRAEMAAFLLRAIGHASHLPAYQGLFADVPAGQWYTGFAEHLGQHGITQGCATEPLRYCPTTTVSRAEMAAFILRGIGHDAHLPTYRGYFADVPKNAWYTPYVEHLYEHGITRGCGTALYCADRPVRRDEMASFIARALGLPPIVPPPAPAACIAGNRVAAGAPQTFRAIPNAGAEVALTFDMGGRMDPAVDIMNFLAANGICATIFATGAMSQTAHGQQVLAIVRSRPDLFEIANHTMHHCDLVRGGGGSPTTAPCLTGGAPSASFIRRELTDADGILRAATGQNPQPYWRPPYGSINQFVIDTAASVGYTKTFLWDIDSIDWKPISDGGPTAQQIADKVIRNAVNGSNVLFHLGGYETLDALRLLVPALRDRGFTLTSLSDLLDGR